VTIVGNDRADGFTRSPPREIRLFLLHGSEEGLIHERARGLVDAIVGHDKDPIRVTRIDRDAAAREPGRIADEVYAVSMFGGHRAIWVEAPSRDLTAAIEPLLLRPPSDSTLVVEAGSLPKSSPLRLAFESAKNAVAIECHPDDSRALGALVDGEAREAGLSLTPEARQYLLALIGSDRLISRAEVAKLMLYAAGSETIEAADVEAIVADAAPSEFDAAIDCALLGDIAGVERASGRFFADGGDAGLLVIRLVARVGLLHRIRLEMEQRRSFEAALQANFFPLSPASRAALARQAERWTSAALGQRLPAIQTVAARARRDPRLAPAIAMRALWALATAVKGR